MKTIACMVLVSDEHIQTELELWMRNIGHYVRAGKGNDARFLVFDSAQTESLWLQLNNSAREVFARDFIDCGTDIEFFKALAARSQKTDREQWFTDGTDWRLCHDDVITKMVIPSYALYHKATVEEIVKHFKNPSMTCEACK